MGLLHSNAVSFRHQSHPANSPSKRFPKSVVFSGPLRHSRTRGVNAHCLHRVLMNPCFLQIVVDISASDPEGDPFQVVAASTPVRAGWFSGPSYLVPIQVCFLRTMSLLSTATDICNSPAGWRCSALLCSSSSTSDGSWRQLYRAECDLPPSWAGM